MEKTQAPIKHTGTTTVGVKVKDAVVLAADMKATMGFFAGELEAKKVFKLTDQIGVTIAGGMGDAQTLVRYLRSQAKLFEIERENPITTKAMATFVANILNGNRYYPFMVQFIMGGFTSQSPRLYSMDAVGAVAEYDDFTVTGSGSEFAIGVFDTQYKSTLKKEDAIKLAVQAVMASKKRDVMSGGNSISVMVIDTKGIQELDRKDVDKIIASYQ
ncbi:MAG: proteasome subunit beta [Candidatus Diapherotrites archaeon]|nr:proteasome subunit beta [Candidatus Diapherotrites archaeon]